MEIQSFLNDEKGMVTLAEILPAVRKLPSIDKVKLIRILAEELEIDESIFPLQEGKTYYLATPYNTFGAAKILMNALGTSDEEKETS